MTTINTNQTTTNMVETNPVDTTAPTTRLPRYRRAATEVGCALTERDFDILALIHAYRLISSEHVQALVAGSNPKVCSGACKCSFTPGTWTACGPSGRRTAAAPR